MDELVEKDLVYFGERAEPYFCSGAIIAGMQNVELSRKYFGLNSVVRWLQVNYYFYQFAGDLLELESEVSDKFADAEDDYIDDLINECLTAGERLRDFSINFGERAKIPSDRKEMAALITSYSKALSDYTIFYQITFFERPIMQMAEDLTIRNARDKEIAAKLFNKISVADRLTAAEHEQDDFLRLALLSGDQLHVAADMHAKKYGWLSVRYFLGEPWTHETVLNRLSGFDKNEAKNELESRLSHRKKIEKRISDAIVDFSERDKKIVSLIRKIIYLRTQRGDFVHESAADAKPMLVKIADELGISYEGLITLSAREIGEALEGRFDYSVHVRNRLKDFLIYHSLSGGMILEGEEVESYIKKHPFLNIEIKNIAEFSGKIAYPGHVRGTAKIVKTNDDLAKFKQGDIIVTAMTTSNLLPALEKASAFITDEGGITCHAAIMAREMKKPCIIGTKIATKVLKDGDLVEVDAVKGIVKVLKKA